MGTVYAFLTKGFDRDGQRVLKVGQTKNWDTRRQGYTGLDAPDDATLLLRRSECPLLVEKTFTPGMSGLSYRHGSSTSSCRGWP